MEFGVIWSLARRFSVIRGTKAAVPCHTAGRAEKFEAIRLLA